MVSCGSSLAAVSNAVWFEGAPATIVLDIREGLKPGSGFLVLDRDDEEPELGEMTYVCLHCLIDEQPELGRAFDLAKRHGGAYLVEGEWQPQMVL